jgi:hypothetical protein
MDKLDYYDFRIDAWLPETLPLKRLAEYGSELAKLFGSVEQVHLLKIRRGSAIPELAVNHAARQAVEKRLSLVGSPNAPAELTRTFQVLNSYLREDGASAVLRRKGGAKLIDFPGRKTPLADEVVVHEAGTLDGVVIRVGGKDDTVPLWLEGEGGERLTCSTSRPIAKDLARHLYGDPVRVSGQGKWRRGPDRVWHMESFVIKTWDKLDAGDLKSAIAQIRAVPGSEWNDMENPQEVWRQIRGDI